MFFFKIDCFVLKFLFTGPQLSFLWFKLLAFLLLRILWVIWGLRFVWRLNLANTYAWVDFTFFKNLLVDFDIFFGIFPLRQYARVIFNFNHIILLMLVKLYLRLFDFFIWSKWNILLFHRRWLLRFVSLWQLRVRTVIRKFFSFVNFFCLKII